LSKKLCVLISVITTFVATVALVIGVLALFTPIGSYLTTRAIITSGFMGEVDSATLDDAALYGMVQEIDDPYSQYLSEQEYSEFMDSLNSEYRGIGIEIYVNPEDNLVTVVGVFENTPAEKAGIRAGDKIIKVNELEVTAETYTQMTTMLKSDPNVSKFEITLLRDGEQLTVWAERQKIDRKTVSGKKIGDNAYVRITEFSDNTTEEFMQALTDTDVQNSNGLIIDLRNNPGGFLNTAVEIADMLLPEGTVVYTANKAGNTRYYKSNDFCIDIPMVLLINQNSASASEVLTGALRDNIKTPVVGMKSFGKGCVQSLIPLVGKAGAIRLTTAYYYSPSGVCIQDVGFTPDYEVELPESAQIKSISDLTLSEDTQLAKAIEILQNR